MKKEGFILRTNDFNSTLENCHFLDIKIKIPFCSLTSYTDEWPFDGEAPDCVEWKWKKDLIDDRRWCKFIVRYVVFDKDTDLIFAHACIQIGIPLKYFIRNGDCVRISRHIQEPNHLYWYFKYDEKLEDQDLIDMYY